MQDGRPGSRLVEWLNALPEARHVLAEDFGGRPVSEQNLSEWKEGGYTEWLAQQESLAQAHELAANAGELSEAGGGLLTDHLVAVLTARYARLLAAGMAKWTMNSGASCAPCVCFPRTSSSCRAAITVPRLKIEQARLNREEDWTEEELIEHFERWVENPKVR